MTASRWLLVAALTLVCSDALAGPPEIPKVDMDHHQEFVDPETGEKRRIVKTKYEMGAELWDESNKRYVRHGGFINLHSDGWVESVTEYQLGKKHGRFERYNKKGVLTGSGTYKNGEREGEWLAYNDDGRLSTREQYEAGRKHGTQIMYNTTIKAEQQLWFVRTKNQGKDHGPYEQYNDDGKKISWGNYVDGKKDGVWYDYDWNGNLRTKTYVNGELQKN